MRRIVSIALVVVAVAAGFVAFGGGAADEVQGKKFKVVFDNAFGITEGGDFRMGGVRAGKTTKLDITGGDRPKAVMTIEISEQGFQSLRAPREEFVDKGEQDPGGATCEIRQQSLIGEYFVDCQPGNNEQKLEEGDTIPVSQTASTVPADLVNNVMRLPYRERLRLIIAELGTGLAGRPEDLNEVIRRAHPGLRETTRVLRILGNQDRIIQDFITDSDTVVRELEAKKREIRRWVKEAGDTAEISASRRNELAAGFERFPTFLAELDTTMARLDELTRAQIPLLRDLRRAAPDLNTFFEELGPFSEASRPATRSLGRASVAGNRAFTEGAEEIVELRRLARDAPGFAKPLRQFLQTIDDRGRHVDVDPRAQETAPPAPDKTRWRNGQGFTGMEAILNYVYWQVLAINSFDEISHTLRVLGFEHPCAEYQSHYEHTPEQEQLHARSITDPRRNPTGPRCSYLGPFQPGINEGDEDPTEGGDNGAAARARDQQQGRDGERRGAGEPEVPAKPGQRDLSQPQFVLPPLLQHLEQQLDQPGADGSGARGPNPEQMLDFLLAP
jgi:ABC-type transporter Mla subunit MlaD